MLDLRALMKKFAFLRPTGKVVSLLLFGLALWVMQTILKSQDLPAIKAALIEIPFSSIVLGLAATMLAYICLVVLDRLALQSRGHNLSWKRVLLSAGVAQALGNSLGLSAVTASAVRFNFYARWGLNGKTAAATGGMASLSIWLGLCLLLCPVLALQSPADFVAKEWLWVIETLALGIIAGFLILCRGQREVRLRRWKFTFPRFSTGLLQILFGAAEWIFFASVLYVLMPDSTQVSFPLLLQYFCLAQLAGVISQVPGGLGVFDSAMLWLLSHSAPGTEFLGSLVVFRAVFYALPLVLAATTLAVYEYRHRRDEIARVKEAAQIYASGIVPMLFAALVFISGMVLLISGTTPLHDISWLDPYLLLPVIEVSHFLASLAGLALLYLAWGLSRRLDAAFVLTVGTLAFGLIVSVLQGANPATLSSLLVELIVLIPSRRYFYRKSSLLQISLSFDWLIAILLVLVGTFWLGSFSYRHIDFSEDLWWQFAISKDAPRFYRSMVGVAIVAFCFGAYRLLRVVQPQRIPVSPADFSKVDVIVQSSPSTHAKLAYLDDKSVFWNEKQTAFLMYATQGRSWIVMGDPVGPESEWPDLIWKFREQCRHYTARPVFYQVQPENLHLYLDLGLTVAKIGEEALVALEKFSLVGSAKQKLRSNLNKAEKEGLKFALLNREEAAACMPVFKKISDEWKTSKNAAEKSFSLGRFDERYLAHFPFAVVKAQDEIVAFANLWVSADRNEVSPDLMRYSSNAPSGVMDYLFLQMILWAQKEGFRHFSLGMAPLSGLKQQRFAPLWHRLGRLVFRYGEHFYNFQGLRRFKDKFEPEWRPIYMAIPSRMALPKVLKDLVLLVGGGAKGVLKK